MFQQQKLYLVLLCCLATAVLLGACVPQAVNESQLEPAPNPTTIVIEESETKTENTLPAPAPIPSSTPVPQPEAPTPAPSISPVPQPDAPTPAMDPLAVTQSFYDWYLESIGDRSSGEFRNLLVERAYLSNPLLTEAFQAQVDELLAGFEGGGYDPFLLAQDIPQDMFAQSMAITGNEARVTVLRSWGPPETDAIFAHLQQVDGVWLINDVTPLELYEPSADTPEGTVQMFYAWYIDAVRRRFVDESVDADFHQSDLLSEGFKQEIDEMRAQAEAEFPEMGLHYDPFLCAQDVPYHVTPDQALIDGETAVLTARTSFQDQIILIELQSTGSGWLIDDVTCIASPQNTAEAFYTWYLGYIGNRYDGNFRNPLVNRAYQGHPLLSRAFVQRIDSMFDEQGYIAYDPFLLAQDLPEAFTVEPGPEEGTAVAHFQFGAEAVSDVLLTMVQENGRWRIDNATQIEPAGVSKTAADEHQTAVSEAHGFSFVYPTDWVLQEMSLAGPGQPDDWPVAAAWMLMPPDVAEYLAGQSGPPDPNAPPVVAPFNIEVVSGDEEALQRVYGELEEGTAEFDVQADYYLRRDPGYKHVIFAHPLRQDTWIVLTDWVTIFPGREDQSQVASPVWEMLLKSIQFSK